ncbi:MAG: CAP domain-containing protein [Bacteroidales bacterium]|nr:CAP domain-containing protein [Bacteroidales bacterium]
MRSILFIFILIYSLQACELADVNKADVKSIDKKKLLDLVNNLRKKGCNCGSTYMPPADKLEWNDEIERAATAHSIDMNENDYFSHTSLDGSSFADRIKGTAYEGSPGGENIAKGYANEEEVFNAWKNSEGHCKNMMNGKFTDIAVGRSGNYWTMNFGIK